MSTLPSPTYTPTTEWRGAAPAFRFVKKPVEITAAQWFKDGDHPMVMKLHTNDVMKEGWGAIHTREGTMEVKPGAWIIRGVAGEFYACDPDVFEQTYTLVGCVHS